SRHPSSTPRYPPSFPNTTLFRSPLGRELGVHLAPARPGHGHDRRSFLRAARGRHARLRDAARVSRTRAVVVGGGVVALLITLGRSEEYTSELQSLRHLVCRLLLE